METWWQEDPKNNIALTEWFIMFCTGCANFYPDASGDAISHLWLTFFSEYKTKGNVMHHAWKYNTEAGALQTVP